MGIVFLLVSLLMSVAVLFALQWWRRGRTASVTPRPVGFPAELPPKLMSYESKLPGIEHPQ
jgi:hypothetical protein